MESTPEFTRELSLLEQIEQQEAEAKRAPDQAPAH